MHELNTTPINTTNLSCRLSMMIGYERTGLRDATIIDIRSRKLGSYFGLESKRKGRNKQRIS